MSTSTVLPPGGGSPTTAGAAVLLQETVRTVRAGLAELTEAPAFGLTGGELGELIGAVTAAVSSLAELQARLVAEAESRGLARDAGCTSTTAWLRTVSGLSGSAAGRVTASAGQVGWRDGGPTDLANGALVGGFHHRLLHGGEWTARMTPDGLIGR